MFLMARDIMAKCEAALQGILYKKNSEDITSILTHNKRN
jgi:hypothetical protein